MQVRFHVAVFRPAHVSERIVLAALFIHRIVAPRSIRARDQEIEFLLIKIGTFEIKADISHQHNASFFAARLHCFADDGVAYACRRYNHSVRSKALREATDAIDVILSGSVYAKVHSVSERKLHAVRVDIDAADRTSIRTQ